MEKSREGVSSRQVLIVHSLIVYVCRVSSRRYFGVRGLFLKHLLSIWEWILINKKWVSMLGERGKGKSNLGLIHGRTPRIFCHIESEHWPGKPFQRPQGVLPCVNLGFMEFQRNSTSIQPLLPPGAEMSLLFWHLQWGSAFSPLLSHLLSVNSAAVHSPCTSSSRPHLLAHRDLYVMLSCFSRVQLCATPWTAVHQASLSITNSQSLLRLMYIESVMPSNHLILCRPLLLSPSIFPSISLFKWVSSSHQVAKVLEFQLHHQSFQWTPRTDFL